MKKFFIDKQVRKDLEKVVKILSTKFKKDLSAVILYGSWVTGRARKDSDIDLLTVFRRKEKNLTRKAQNLIEEINTSQHISLVSTSLREFKQETLPLFTAAKKEGCVIYGKIDLALNSAPPEYRYRDFLKRSQKFERGKIETAQHLIKKEIFSGVGYFCYLASKHAIQAGLAAKGVGFSSKFCTLVKWAEKYFGKETAKTFASLFKLYVKSEYKMQDLTKKENLLAIKKAKKILERAYPPCT